MTILELNASSQNLSSLNISLVLEWSEKLDIQYDIKRLPNQSATILIKQNPFLYINLVCMLENSSIKDEIYTHLGIKHDYMSYGNNLSYPNIWITKYNPIKIKGKNDYWEATLQLVRE